jgi:HSP20 family protein
MKDMKEQMRGLQPIRKAGPLKLATVSQIFDDMREAFDSIARRAYEIFENNGRQLGRDLEDWFKAEAELLHPVHLDVSESEDTITVRAEVPGFDAKELQISLEPHRLTIAGKRESKKEEKKGTTLYSERCSNQVFRSVDLPAEVDADKVTATLKDGILEVEMRKAAQARKIRIESKAA